MVNDFIRNVEEKVKDEEKKLETGIKGVLKKISSKEKTEDQSLKETAIKKLNRLEKKKINQSVFDEFTWILKVFLSNHLKIEYEYTHQELVKELARRRVKHKADIIRLSEEIVEVDYDGKPVDQESFVRMVEEAKRIISKI
ncbi:hypothetical protein FJZ53_05455 [Candidatus Woesearchaeota archaeon]|nr:hypothetical protein [Candidatus Woesearchaeota archaeon]